MSARAVGRAARRACAVAVIVLGAGASCGTSEPPRDRVALANRALDEALPKKALSEVADATSGPELVARMQAIVQLDEWGLFEKLDKNVPAGPQKAALACLIAAQRKDVDGERKCRADFSPSALGDTLYDATQRALGRTLEIEHRPAEAELALRKLAERRPTAANRKAVVSFLERQGFVREAVEFVEGWLATTEGDTSLRLKLVQLIERKVRGDLLERRADDAEAGARRVLQLDPTRAQVRYFLADALELKGDKTAAEAERATARAAGAKPPPSAEGLPGDDAPDGGHDGHDGHDHP